MFQSFETTSNPEHGQGRLQALRQAMKQAGLDGFIVPRADAHQGEYVAACDRRLEWLTGFSGSAGFCIALSDKAGVFIDGRYRNQVRGQVDLAVFTPVHWPETQPGDWLTEWMPTGGRVGFDPWLHTKGEIEKIEKSCGGSGIELVSHANLIDPLWTDRPAPPASAIRAHDAAHAGRPAGEKCAEIARTLRDAGQRAAVVTLSDSIAWLLNIRGDDIAHIPVVQGFAILHDDARVEFFTAEGRAADLAGHQGAAIALCPVSAFSDALAALCGPVRLDKATAPVAVADILAAAGTEIAWDDDPCILPKACKNAVEIAGARAAHLTDAVAMVEFLTWFDMTAGHQGLTEIDLVTELETQRRSTNALLDISFETIAGSGPNGAIMHYRVTQDTNRELEQGDLVVIDSGGQYVNGTTDITRTVPVGAVGDEEKTCFTRVLQGMIAISRTRFPRGVSGRDLDALARFPLWAAGQDFNHGTGHGVGSYLSVHEGPQRISRVSEVPLQPGMILSNEPGYYRDGAFGIRIENLIVVSELPLPEGADDRDMLGFETLTFVPVDRRLIRAEMLSPDERAWINAYHALCREKLSARLSSTARDWIRHATAPI